jgi:hypothetical protein
MWEKFCELVYNDRANETQNLLSGFGALAVKDCD